MSLLLRHNADANPNNALKLTQNVVREKGVAQPALNNYALSVDVTTLGDEIQSIQIDGQTYTFDTAVDLTGTDAEILAQLRAGIEAAYVAHNTYLAGGDSAKVALVYEGNLFMAKDGNTLTVNQYRSHVVLNSLTDDTATPVVTPFTATVALRG